MLWIDHVIWAVADLEEAGALFERDFGLRSFSGGVHFGGTTNRVIPLQPPQYVELLAVTDFESSEADDWGRVVNACIRKGGGLVAWAVGTNDIEAFGARTGASVVAGSIELEKGHNRSWRIADPSDVQGGLPFAIQYDEDAAEREDRQRAAFAAADHPCGAQSIAWVEVSCEEQKLNDWLGSHELSIRVGDGSSELRRVGLRLADGQVVVLG